ncbi:MAG: CHAP domain-containing protein, partial [Minisyncoccia bacterium]
SSNDLSDFVDKQVYQSTVQDKIKSELDTITALKLQLQDQKNQVEQLLKDQQNLQAQLSSAQNQQAQLLAFNQGQQAVYDQQITSNQSKIADLRRQQILLNGQYNIGDFKGDPNNGGYPSIWANAPQDSMIDDWGMYNRECVSYTAFKVHQDFLAGKDHHDMPYWGGIGNANQWDDDARAYGIPVDSNPTPGSIAISNAGFYGHAMYVEAVNGNEVYVQQYNQQLTGQYSEGWRYTTGLVFIHF